MRPEARVGTVFNEWRLETLLGAGSVAATYAARRFEARAAIRILHEHLALSEPIRERFLALADVTREIDHPGLARIVAADTTRDGEVFLQREWLEGETLDAAWRGHELHRVSVGAASPAPTQPTMNIDRALPIFVRVLDCLSACHEHGVLHRGLKPSNVFLTEGDTIKLLDFRAAEIIDALPDDAATGTDLGTPTYMAPEQAMGLVDQLDGRADTFSIGAMMHALITGHPINDGMTAEESLVIAATTPVPTVSILAPRLPGVVVAIIDKALRWDRRERYASAREMHDAIVAAIRETRVS